MLSELCLQMRRSSFRFLAWSSCALAAACGQSPIRLPGEPSDAGDAGSAGDAGNAGDAGSAQDAGNSGAEGGDDGGSPSLCPGVLPPGINIAFDDLIPRMVGGSPESPPAGFTFQPAAGPITQVQPFGGESTSFVGPGVATAVASSYTTEMSPHGVETLSAFTFFYGYEFGNYTLDGPFLTELKWGTYAETGADLAARASAGEVVYQVNVYPPDPASDAGSDGAHLVLAVSPAYADAGCLREEWEYVAYVTPVDEAGVGGVPAEELSQAVASLASPDAGLKVTTALWPTASPDGGAAFGLYAVGYLEVDDEAIYTTSVVQAAEADLPAAVAGLADAGFTITAANRTDGQYVLIGTRNNNEPGVRQALVTQEGPEEFGAQLYNGYSMIAAFYADNDAGTVFLDGGLMSTVIYEQ